MCRGVPGRVLAVDGLRGTVDFWGTRKEVRLDLVDEPVAVGDHVFCHLDFAIRRIPPEDVAEMLGLYDDLLTSAELDEGDEPRPTG